MSDIEDELLALAGGDSDDDAPRISTSPNRDASPSPSPVKSRETIKAPAKKASRRPRQDEPDEEEEEGQASSTPGTPNSLDSAPMDESGESESEPEPEPSRPPRGAGTLPPADDDSKYPVDGMYVSHAEKAEIMGMREMEREQLIADRISEIERQRQNRLLRQMVTNVENEERKQVKKKRSADTAELDDGPRKPSKPRTGKSGETAMDTLRRARAEKQRRKEDHERRKDDYSPEYGARDESDDDYGRDGRDGRDYGRARSRTPEAEPEPDIPPAELRDYERTRLGRNEFAQVCFTPGFQQAITGCYMRIALGPHPDTGVEQYRMAAIKGFTTNRPYALNGPSGAFVTDQYVRAAHGKAAKEFPFIAASSGKFTENELHRYQVTCQNDTVTVPTKAHFLDKISDINNLINHNWTREEIKASVAKKQELRRRFDPEERARMARLLEEARDKGEDEKVEGLQQEFDKLSTQRLAFRTSLGPSKISSSGGQPIATEQDRLAERNRENRRMNVEAVRKAQLKEKTKVRDIERAIKRGETGDDDPSRRMRTKAKFVHEGASDGSGASTPANGKQSMVAHLAKLQGEKQAKKGMPTISKPLMDDDVIGALDLDIDMDI